jgi:hypothetical protein
MALSIAATTTNKIENYTTPGDVTLVYWAHLGPLSAAVSRVLQVQPAVRRRRTLARRLTLLRQAEQHAGAALGQALDDLAAPLGRRFLRLGASRDEAFRRYRR